MMAGTVWGRLAAWLGLPGRQVHHRAAGPVVIDPEQRVIIIVRGRDGS